MTYQPPPKEQPPKPRYMEVTDIDLISAIQRGAFADPIGHEHEGKWYAEVGSLRQYRNLPNKAVQAGAEDSQVGASSHADGDNQ